jgi:hypothetical protein
MAMGFLAPFWFSGQFAELTIKGKLLEKDLGPDTAKLAQAMSDYNPDQTWTLVKP